MLNQTGRKTSTLRRILADERGVNVVEYVAVSGIAMLVAGLIIVAMMNSRGQIGRVMAQVHARQVASFEGGGGGGSININAALTPRAPVPSIPQAAWPTLAIPGIVIEAPTIGAPPQDAPNMPQPPIAAPPIPLAAPVAMPVVGLPALFTAFGGDSGAGMATLVAGATTAALAAFAVYSRATAASTTSAVPAWLAALGKVLLGVVIGVVVLAALAALIYFGAAALAAIGIGAGITFAAALVIAGVVLAVGFVAYEFWTRLQEFRAARGEPGFWDYVKIGGLSIASLTGIPQIIEAIRGTRLLTGVPLSAQQRWELGIGGVVQLALVAVGVRAFWRRFRTVEAPVPKPVSLAEWKPGDPLPAFDKAAIDPAKFNRYSMDPTNVNNGGKWKAFEQLGYNVSDDAARTNAAADVISQLRAQLARTPAKQGSNTNFGQRFEVRTPIKGPNGKTGTLVTVWQFDQGSTTPRLITNWLEVHN